MQNITYKQPAYGIINGESDISICHIKSPSDLRKYDFLISLERVSNYNGNKTFYMNILPLKELQQIAIHGWKVVGLRFPGCWFFHWGVWKLQDRYGKCIDYVCDSHKDKLHFEKEPEWLLLKSIKAVTFFAQNTPFVSYFDFIEQPSPWHKVCYGSSFNSPVKQYYPSELAPKDNFISLKGFEQMIDWIKLYHDILVLLFEQTNERTNIFLEKINTKYSEVINKYIALKITEF